MRTNIHKPAICGSLILLATILLSLFSLAACSGGGGSKGVALTVSPATASVVTGLSIPLAANIAGVTWSVNGIPGGNAAVGTVSLSGVYTAPYVKPSPAVVAVTATTADATKSASAQITIINLALSGPGGGYSGSFSAVGDMVTARSNHTATLLVSGNVLVAGGIGASGAAIADAELFRPNFSNFSSASKMNASRAYHTATLLQNGKVLISGGVDKNNHVLAQSELYDPATGMFTATGNMSTGRVYHSATLLMSGKVLIAGGSAVADLTTGVPLDSLEIYDPATGTFTSPAASVMTDARFSHSAQLLNGGKVLLVGGIGVAGQKLGTAELYDPASTADNKVAVTGSMSTPRWLNTISPMADGSILVTGGSSGTISGNIPSSTYLASAEKYDPAAGIFTNLSPAQLIDSRGFFTTTLLADQTLLSTGGFGLLSTDPLQMGSSLATAELFDPISVKFSYTQESMPLQRANHTATMLPSSGKVLILGGGGYSAGGFTVMNSAILYQ